MIDILNFVNDNPWLNIVFIALTLSSIFLSVWFYLKSKKTRKPTYALRTFNLVKEKINKIDSVDILYHGFKIENLSISKLAVWNAGKETISSTDVAQNDPFIITIEDDFEILDFNIQFERNRANGFRLEIKDSNKIEISFDYFDYNEGLIVLLYHTATDDNSIALSGSFKNTKSIQRTATSTSLVPDIVYRTLRNGRVRPKLMKRILGVLVIILPIIMVIGLFASPEKEVQSEPSFFSKMIMACVVTIPYWYMGFRVLRRKVPKGFSLFEDEF